MTGGTGNDVYYVDNAADARDRGGERRRRPRLQQCRLHPRRQCRASLHDRHRDHGTGNGLANLINGTAGHNVIKGGDGADVILGGGGDDDLYGEAGNDSFIFGLASGHDTIFAFDADPAGGQDKIDLQTRGITAASFAADVSISASGPSTP